MKTTKLMSFVVLMLVAVPAFARHTGEIPEARTKPSQSEISKPEKRTPCSMMDEAAVSLKDSVIVNLEPVRSEETRQPFHHMGRLGN